MKRFRIVEGCRDIQLLGDYRAAHYIECNSCEQTSPFTVTIDGFAKIIFMSEILSIELDEINKKDEN